MTVGLDIKTHKLITCTDYDLPIHFMSVCNQSLTSCNYFRMQEEDEEEEEMEEEEEEGQRLRVGLCAVSVHSRSTAG